MVPLKLIAEAEGYRAEVVNRAAGDASRFDQVYEAYKSNPDVTKERIYIETVEEIFSNVEKTIMTTCRRQRCRAVSAAAQLNKVEELIWVSPVLSR